MALGGGESADGGCRGNERACSRAMGIDAGRRGPVKAVKGQPGALVQVRPLHRGN
jgi:hypothetical protein